MRGALYTWGICALLASSARADFQSQSHATSMGVEIGGTAADHWLTSFELPNRNPSVVQIMPMAAEPQTGNAASSRVMSLPPLPGGNLLCLSGLVSLGALHTVRRARQGPSLLPEWYCEAVERSSDRSLAIQGLPLSFEWTVLTETIKLLTTPIVQRLSPVEDIQSVHSQWRSAAPITRGPPSRASM